MTLDEYLGAQDGAGRPELDPDGTRVFLGFGEGWYADAEAARRAWRDWRGDREVGRSATVTGPFTVVEYDVRGDRIAPATVLYDARTNPPELRIYVDPEDAA